jgi:hypothetical protein
VIDTRRYQRAVALVGVGVLVVFSAFLLVAGGVESPGVQAGRKLHRFVAPLATSGIDKPANADPHCDPAMPNARALNMCNRRPIVLAFFSTGAGDCIDEVTTLQRVSSAFPRVEFAALAVNASVSDIERLERRHRWTIPIAVDSDGRVGALYGVNVCPMIEIARAGGLVVRRLVGDRWLSAQRLAAQVRALGAPASP